MGDADGVTVGDIEGAGLGTWVGGSVGASVSQPLQETRHFFVTVGPTNGLLHNKSADSSPEYKPSIWQNSSSSPVPSEQTVRVGCIVGAVVVGDVLGDVVG